MNASEAKIAVRAGLLVTEVYSDEVAFIGYDADGHYVMYSTGETNDYNFRDTVIYTMYCLVEDD